MLWDAGQERIGRDRNDRLAELFVAARDAHLDVLVTTGTVKPKGTWHLPSYVRSDEPAQLRSPAIRDMALAQLGLTYPGIVRTDS